MMFFWILDLWYGWLRLKSRLFIAIVTMQDTDADENAIMVLCACVHTWYHGKVFIERTTSPDCGVRR